MDVLHEAFLAQLPRAGNPRERLPLMSRREPRRAVVTQHAGDEVLAGVAPVGAREKRRKLALVAPGIRIAGRYLRACDHVVDRKRVRNEVLRRRAKLAIVVVDVLVAAGELELMIPHQMWGIREQLLEVQLRQIAVHLARIAAELGAERIGAREVGAPHSPAVVGAQRRLRRETFDQTDRRGEVAQQAILRRLVLNLLHHPHRVEHARGATLIEAAGRRRARLHVAAAIDRIRRVVDHHVGEQAAIEATGVLVR